MRAPSVRPSPPTPSVPVPLPTMTISLATPTERAFLVVLRTGYALRGESVVLEFTER